MHTSGETYKTLEQLMKSYEAKPQTGTLEQDHRAKRTGNVNIEANLEYGQNRNPKLSQGPKSPQKNVRPTSGGIAGRRPNPPVQKEDEEDYEVIDINTMLLQEEDERFRYLLKYGNIKRIEKNNSIIYAELPQIPGTLVFYRKKNERENSTERLFLDSKELTHIPLLEGEEALKLLSLKNNTIDRIQNLVSLPNLIYLDLTNNKISELENFQGMANLRVLIVGKNKLTKIKNLDCLNKLEILDLHSNLITNTEGLKSLSDLKTLNLEDNLISGLEDFMHLTKLVELNLSINKIENLDPLSKTKNLNKLYLAKNAISKPKFLKSLKLLAKLTELNLENNPISEDKILYYQLILELCESLATLDSTPVSQIKEDLNLNDEDGKNRSANVTDRENEKMFGNSQSNFRKKEDYVKANKINTKTVSKYKSVSPGKPNDAKNRNNYKDPKSASLVPSDQKLDDSTNSSLEPEKVITIIKDQFAKEIQRVEKLKRHGITTRKELYRESLLEGGHAEMENNTILYLYGNAFEVMLPNPSFQNTVEEIHFEYVIFDLLVQTKFINHLKQYKALTKIVLMNNNIQTFLQIAKLEALPSLQSLTIRENPVASCELLKEFVIYRFPDLLEFNESSVDEPQRVTAKNKFKEFDNVLIFPLEFYKDSYKGQAAQKTVDDFSDVIVKKTLAESVELKNNKNIFEVIWSSYVGELIKNSLNQVKTTKNTYY